MVVSAETDAPKESIEPFMWLPKAPFPSGTNITDNNSIRIWTNFQK